MKELVIITLCSSLVLQSCYSYYTVSEERQRLLLENGGEDIQMTLKGGEEVAADEDRYLLTTRPDSFYYGVGEILNTVSGERTAFRGKLYPIRVGEGKMTKSSSWGQDEYEQIYCWIDDTTMVVFRTAEYIHVTQEGGAGVYVSGRDGAIPPDSIETVEERKINPVTTSLSGLFVGVPLVFALVLIIACAGQNCKFGSPGREIDGVGKQ